MRLVKKIPSSVWILAPLVILLSLPFVLPVGAIVYSSITERLNRISFDAELWKRSGQPYGSNDTRLTMVDDLIRSQLLIGKSREEVVELLGETDGDHSIKDRYPNWQMYFYLGPSRSTILFKGFDYDYLVLRFDEQGKVNEAGIVTLKT
jgi:hypothetical protein